MSNPPMFPTPPIFRDSRVWAKTGINFDSLFSFCHISNIELAVIISTFSACNFAMRRSCLIQLKVSDRSVKRVQNVRPLLKIFLVFSIMAVRASLVLYFFQKLHWNFFSSFGLFSHTRDVHKCLKARVI